MKLSKMVLKTVRWHLGDVNKLLSFLTQESAPCPLWFSPIPLLLCLRRVSVLFQVSYSLYLPLSWGSCSNSSHHHPRQPLSASLSHLKLVPLSPTTLKNQTKPNQTPLSPPAGAHGSSLRQHTFRNSRLFSWPPLPHLAFTSQPTNMSLPPPRFTKIAHSKLGHQLLPNFHPTASVHFY